MKRFGLWTALIVFLFLFTGCTAGAYNVATVSEPQASNGYCHKRLQPLGPTDPARTGPSDPGDYIDYYGPCDGPSPTEQIQQQRRFERFRFGREYMDEG